MSCFSYYNSLKHKARIAHRFNPSPWPSASPLSLTNRPPSLLTPQHRPLLTPQPLASSAPPQAWRKASWVVICGHERKFWVFLLLMDPNSCNKKMEPGSIWGQDRVGKFDRSSTTRLDLASMQMGRTRGRTAHCDCVNTRRKWPRSCSGWTQCHCLWIGTRGEGRYDYGAEIFGALTEGD